MNCLYISDERLANKTNQAVVMEVNSSALGLFVTKSCASYDVIKELFYCSETEFKLCFEPHTKNIMNVVVMSSFAL